MSYLISDHLGSTSIITDASGTVINQTKYKAWGETRYSSGTNPTDYTYTGQYSYTDDFGLMFYNARWYDSSLGRFAQADTIVPSGIQGLDRYAYVNNSPMNYIDPSGHMACQSNYCDPRWQNIVPLSEAGQRQKATEAEERVMSLLGFDTFMEYNQWAVNNGDLANILLNAEAGDIVRFSYNNQSGFTSYFDWMIMEYEDGYTFYDISNQSRITQADTDGFAEILSNFVTGAGVFHQNNREKDYIPGVGTTGFNFGLPMILLDNWNQPIDGGVIQQMSRPSAGENIQYMIGVGSLVAAPFFPPVGFAGAVVGGFSAIGPVWFGANTVPRYKEHPYGP
ncbi:MAG: RHS repeat-associated core domain-containing protein [Anaerolineales bacterium]|nr:RHS repeat-associated core domain-containing protein [Anaerolineales bacterium]MBX3038065.1 RHS repeat-associated core domain-containing protein [Anaerolineales bacterium]